MLFTQGLDIISRLVDKHGDDDYGDGDGDGDDDYGDGDYGDDDYGDGDGDGDGDDGDQAKNSLTITLLNNTINFWHLAEMPTNSHV